MTSPGQPTSILRLAMPIAFAQLANMLMQIVDMIFVGRLGPEQLGGLSIGNAAFAMVMIAGVGLLLGLDYYVSHALGAKKQDEANAMLIQGLYLAVFVALPSILLLNFAPLVFDPFGITEPVAGHGTRYLKVLSYSLLPWLIFSAFRQYLQSMGAALPIFVILILANIVNAAANWILVFGHWGFSALGVEGSAWATAIARAFMCLCIAGYVLYRNRRLNLGLERASLRISWERLRKLVRMGTPAGAQLLLEVAVFALSTLLAGRLGAVDLSAHQIVLQIASVTFMVPLGVSSATAVLVARSLGAGDRAAAAAYGWRGFAIGIGFMAFCGIGLLLVPDPLLRIFTQDPAVLQLASQLLILAALFQVFDGAQVVGSGALRGSGNTRASLFANFVGHWVIGLPTGALLCFKGGYGVWGLWIGLTAGLVFVAFALLWIWRGIVSTHRVS